MVRQKTLSLAQSIWSRMNDRQDWIPLGHDGYLKRWALSRPKLNASYIMLDEAQDTNSVVLQVLEQQSSQLVFVGDPYQQIYEWRGATNAMNKFNECNSAFLTQSFRFGQEIANVATAVIRTFGEKRALKGNPELASFVGRVDNPRAKLSRTNAGVIQDAVVAMQQGRSFHIIGGSKTYLQLVGDVVSLKQGIPGKSAELFGFSNWHEVVDFANKEGGEELSTFVNLVEQFGEQLLDCALKSSLPNENDAELIASTVHRSKGCEWDTVRISGDILASASRRNLADIKDEDRRLFYVAISRAKEGVDVDPKVLNAFISIEKKNESHHLQGSNTPVHSLSVEREPALSVEREPGRNWRRLFART